VFGGVGIVAQVFADAQIDVVQDLVGCAAADFREKLDSPGKRAFISRAIALAERQFRVEELQVGMLAYALT
jgi:hypothetical protein